VLHIRPRTLKLRIREAGRRLARVGRDPMLNDEVRNWRVEQHEADPDAAAERQREQALRRQIRDILDYT
jgi:hypothetical protein